MRKKSSSRGRIHVDLIEAKSIILYFQSIFWKSGRPLETPTRDPSRKKWNMRNILEVFKWCGCHWVLHLSEADRPPSLNPSGKPELDQIEMITISCFKLEPPLKVCLSSESAGKEDAPESSASLRVLWQQSNCSLSEREKIKSFKITAWWLHEMDQNDSSVLSCMHTNSTSYTHWGLDINLRHKSVQSLILLYIFRKKTCYHSLEMYHYIEDVRNSTLEHSAMAMRHIREKGFRSVLLLDVLTVFSLILETLNCMIPPPAFSSGSVSWHLLFLKKKCVVQALVVQLLISQNNLPEVSKWKV